MTAKRIVLGVLAVMALLFFITAGGAIVWLLWNAVLPDLFGWPRIGFWQALGLLALCRILFGGFGGHAGRGSRIRRRVKRRIRRRMGERWEQMTPEERERVRERMRERWGAPPPAGEGEGS